jgi:hypothetical protein
MINRYLILDDFHSIPIFELNPDSIKESVKNAKSSYLNPHSEKNINHTALLSAVSKKLGFEGGFRGFKNEYNEKLIPFLKKNNLKKHINLFSIEENNSNIKDLSYLSNTNMINIGYDRDKDIILFFLKPREVADRLFLQEKYGYPKTKIDKILLKFTMKINVFETIQNDENIDELFSDMFNLLGNLLLKPRTELNIVLKQYVQNPTENFKIIEEKYKQSYKLAQNLLPEMDSYDKAWVDLVPYNENLIFLRDKEGNYDFVFRNLKDMNPPNLAEYYEKVKFIPSYTKEEFDFFYKMLYFIEIWEEYERNEAEKYYYANGGTISQYPTEDKILFDYLKSKGKKES